MSFTDEQDELGFTSRGGLIDSIPFYGPRGTLKHDDPTERPEEFNVIEARILILSNADDMKEYQRILKLCGNERGAMTQQVVYDQAEHTFKAFVVYNLPVTMKANAAAQRRLSL